MAKRSDSDIAAAEREAIHREFCQPARFSMAEIARNHNIDERTVRFVAAIYDHVDGEVWDARRSKQAAASASTMGFLEDVTPRRVSGWCFDDGETPLEVELLVGTTRIGTARADRPREDIRRKHQRLRSGFLFPISHDLFDLLPHGAKVEVVAKGRPLPVLNGCIPNVDNPSGTGKRLLEMIEGGYRFSLKDGSLFRPVAQGDAGKRINALDECADIFHQTTGKRFFVCYGTLLGLVREGGFIEHDDDVDVCFLAEAEGLDAAWREFRDVAAALKAAGEDVSVLSRAQFHWHRAGSTVDVFMAWMEGSELYMYNAGGRFSRSQIHPLRRREFEGRGVLVPNDPEALLELIYGPGWTVPDPMFQWSPTPAVAARMRQLRTMRDVDAHEEIKRHWSRFYNSRRHTTIPSPFAAAVCVELEGPCRIVDIGCGNGRDSHFFAQLGHDVLGLDIVAPATRREADNVCFMEVDASIPDDLAEVIHSVAGAGQLVVYARFFFHAVTEEGETAVLDVLSEHLPRGARCYFEFRTSKDENIHKHFHDHYRRFVNLDAFVDKAISKGTMDRVYTVEGQGMAKFGEEDPFVGRVHLRQR